MIWGKDSGGSTISESPSGKDIETLVAAFGRLAPADRERLLSWAVTLADWSDPPNAIVAGTVWYRERMAMPSDAVVAVSVDRMHNGASELIAEQQIDQPGNVPVPFHVPFAVAAIDPTQSYALTARITSGDRVQWATPAPIPVLTDGAPNRVDVMLVRAGAN